MSAVNRNSEGRRASHKLNSLKAQPGSHHHFSNAETYQLATFINARFADEPLLKTLLPVDRTDPDSFFDAWGDGRLLICLVDAASDEDVVDLESFRRRASKPLGVSVRHLTIQHFAMLNDALEGCKNIKSLQLGFVGAEDFVQGNRPVILGVGWQLVRLSILKNINVAARPELAELFTPDELAKHMGKSGQEEIILARWFNQHLEAVGSDRQVWSFGTELADGVAWCALLNAIDPAACPPPDEQDAAANATNVIEAVHKMGIKGVFLTPDSLMASEKKPNLMFCAQIMDVHPTIPSYLRPPPTSKSGRPSFASNYDSRSGTSTAASSMYTSSQENEYYRNRHVGSSSPPPPAPSPPKSSWGFGFSSGRAPPSEAQAAREGLSYYDSDGEMEEESAPGCGLGFGGLFSCISRN